MQENNPPALTTLGSCSILFVGGVYTLASRLPTYSINLDRIKQAREALNLSRREAARQANISNSMWQAVESGTRMPSLETLRRMAKVLGKPFQVFVD